MSPPKYLLISCLISVIFAANCDQYCGLTGCKCYEILGIPRNSSINDIKKVYKNLSKQYHPDLNPDKDTNSQFIEMTNCYEVLRDEQEKTAYDVCMNKPLLGEFSMKFFMTMILLKIRKSLVPKIPKLSASAKKSIQVVFSLAITYLTFSLFGYHTRKALASTLIYFCYKLGRFFLNVTFRFIYKMIQKIPKMMPIKKEIVYVQ